MRKSLAISLLLLGVAGTAAFAQDAQKENSEEKFNTAPVINGTVRAKFEWQPDIGASRFQVRNARISMTGKVTPIVSYKAEIDFNDEGSMKMSDAYVRLAPVTNFNFTIGQMRVPFTIDAHRSPHQQYFANRSFIAKQVGNVRDVGATLSYTTKTEVPVTLQGGIFNGSGITDQKNYWTESVNFSVKGQVAFPQGFNVVLSAQKVKPDNVNVMMYDAGAFYHGNNWHVEAEWLYKHYADDAFDAVNAFDAFVCYDLKLKNSKAFKKISFLGRWDYMDDHSDGIRYDENGDESTDGTLIINDYKRHRATVGMTFSLSTPFVSDIRLNYEKYFYDDGATKKISEQDKLVVEFMVRF